MPARKTIGDMDGIRLCPPTAQPWAGAEQPDKNVAVLMSGGVDSSVTAMVLKEAGWNVLGVTMKLAVAEGCDYRRSCCGTEAAYVCRDLGIPHYFIDARRAFERLVIEPFRRAYADGRTPSPCVDCNTFLKFGLAWDVIEEELGVKRVATGHYARVIGSNGAARLARATDRSRDQSYFLYGVPRERLPFLLLPLGEMSKDQTRALARAARLPVARRPDSMELCFAAEGDYREALSGVPAERGRILDAMGSVLGEHEGITGYTVGQRRGLRVAAGKPLYVTGISASDNTITVGPRADLYYHTVRATDLNILVGGRLRRGAILLGKMRSQGEPAECRVTDIEEGVLSVHFDLAQFAPTPGQRLVLYDREGRVVAGGTIVEDTQR